MSWYVNNYKIIESLLFQKYHIFEDMLALKFIHGWRSYTVLKKNVLSLKSDALFSIYFMLFVKKRKCESRKCFSLPYKPL